LQKSNLTRIKNLHSTMLHPYNVPQNLLVSDALYAAYDPRLGVMTAARDPNGLLTRWTPDHFGRITERVRPDGTWTTTSLERAKDGGPQGSWWALTVTTTEDAGPTSTTRLDGAGRPVHTSAEVAGVKSCGTSRCASTLTLEKESEYDLFGRVTRETRPWLSGDALQGKYADTYVYDAAGRMTKHTEPWGRVTTYRYSNNVTSATDWLGVSSTEVDALGRTIVTTDKQGGTTATTYGPFSLPEQVARLGTESTTMVRDAYGRVIREIDPDRGVTDTTYDGFGEALTMADALGRTFAFTYDGIGRLVQRVDATSPATSFTTTWTYDTAANGIGLVAQVTSPASHVDTFGYDALSRPSVHTLTFGDTGDTFTSAVDYDTLGRPWHVTYPWEAGDGAAPLQVRRAYDAFGNLIALYDDSAATTFWQLRELDGAGRPSEEVLGNGVVVSHAYDPRSGLVEHIGAEWGRIKLLQQTLEDLSYTYDVGLRMQSRSDVLQPATEYFQHDALDRLTCAGVGLARKGYPPCEHPIAYLPNGNIDAKDGVGSYAYDPLHPHAVKTAGASSFAYDAVGNQVQRPSVSNIAYTPFDLPSSFQFVAAVTIGGVDSSIVLDYDGDQHRIRKTRGSQRTEYFDDLYERATDGATGVQQHQHFVAAGSSTVMLARSAGAADQVAYLLTEALGSVDVVTGGTGDVIERRSYDAFGARRNPAWGSQAPVVVAAASPVGFTGQEDDELGLVNMKGRIYDPTVGRFMTTDPLVSTPGFTQSWNPYSYVWNSPLRFTDPSGFAPGDGTMSSPNGPIALPNDLVTPGEPFKVAQCLSGGACGSAPPGGSTPAKDAAADDAKGGRSTSTDAAGATGVAGAPSAPAVVDRAVGLGSALQDQAADAQIGLLRTLRLDKTEIGQFLTDLNVYGKATQNAQRTPNELAAKESMKPVLAVVQAGMIAAGGVRLLAAGPAPVAVKPPPQTGEGTVSMFRAVSPEELTDIMQSGQFRSTPGGASLGGKQFGLDLGEVLKFSDHYPDVAAIVKVEVPRSSFAQFDFSKSIDSFIFKSGVVTVQPGGQQTLLNATLTAVEHVF
jgi:RHS repeat-associated protein